MSQDKSLFETITGFFVPIHADGQKFVVIAIIITLFFFFLSTSLGWVGVILTCYVGYFFRDPERVTPLREGLIVAPADGKISAIEKMRAPSELGLGDGERVRVSIFLSVFDVHINRAPVAGVIKRSIYTPGAFLNADLDKASEENERRSYVIETSSGAEIGAVQIAGLIARRIVTFVKEGSTIGVGERIGLIRFGSRMDVYLPPGHDALVAVGQRAVGGETVLGDLKSDEPEREARIG